MSLMLVIFLSAILIVCLAGIFLSFSLYRKYDLRFIMFLHYHVLASSIFGFALFFIWNIMSLVFFSLLSGKILVVFHMFQLLQLPLVFLVAFLFVNFMAELAESKASARVTHAIIAYAILISIALVFGYIHYVRTGDSFIYGKLLVFGVMLVIFLIKVGAIRYAYKKSLGIKITLKKRLILRVGILYLVGYTLYYSMSLLHGVFPDLTAIIPFLWFSVNIPPLILIHRYLDKYQLRSIAIENMPAKLDLFSRKFGISRREKEIVEYILKGCSNYEIEEQLFISEKTVKNHIYNIYRKVGVNSRTQMIKSILRF